MYNISVVYKFFGGGVTPLPATPSSMFPGSHFALPPRQHSWIRHCQVLSVFLLLEGRMEADVERGQVLFHSWFPCGAGPPISPLPWSRHPRAERARGAHVSRMSSIRSTRPNTDRRRFQTIFLNGCWEVRRRISTLVIWSDQGIPQMRSKRHWSNALFLFLTVRMGNSASLGAQSNGSDAHCRRVILSFEVPQGYPHMRSRTRMAALAIPTLLEILGWLWDDALVEAPR